MVVAFLDLLGFSHLINDDTEAAYYNLELFNHAIEVRIRDSVKLSNSGDNDFFENQLLTSFKHMISISDSLIIGSTKADLFLRQLSCFVARLFIDYSNRFEQPFLNIKSVKREGFGHIDENHNVFPILFRGGISFGDDVNFFPELYINDIDKKEIEKYKYGLNVRGRSYVEAVNLEGAGKGPRLFCNKKFIDMLSDDNKNAIRIVDKEKNLYEIVWTYYACEVSKCSSNKMNNVIERINQLLLPRVINLYRFYQNSICKNHYVEFVKLSCRGIKKYALDNKLDMNSVDRLINTRLQNIELDGWIYENDVLDFLK